MYWQTVQLWVFPACFAQKFTIRTVASGLAQGYKSFFMLSWVEHEILNAHKYKNIEKFFRLR